MNHGISFGPLGVRETQTILSTSKRDVTNMILLCSETVFNPSALETRSLPKKIIGRVQILPRSLGPLGWARLILEMQLVRYLTTLLPFLALILFSRDLALPVTQAPLAMILVIGVVELKVLRLSDAGRKRLMTQDAADRIHDAFAFRAKALLRRVAAMQGLAQGDLRLVVEQSELARVPPLTFVSVQCAEPAPHLLDLQSNHREILQELFDDTLTERDLHRANLRTDTAVREVQIAATGVSAHSRLAAWIDAELGKG